MWIEIDAASNNGVDSIRELRESVKYPPVKGRNKVYIIDEVHMLSQGAFNALLKTLEEPPQNVVFILATTEPQKLPATILSRCMRLDFRRVSEESIIDNMKMICRARGIEADPGALSLIAVNADGSVRDSLSILEQCISTGADSICRDDVAELLGTAGEESLIGLTGCIIRGQISEALLLLDRIIRSGSDVKQFMKEWLTHFRSLLMAKYVAQPENILSMSVENVLRVKEQSAEITTELLNRGITDLTKTIAEARWSSQPRVLLEMCIVRLGAPQESEETFAFRNDAVRTSLQQNAAAEKTDTAQIRSDSAASDRVSEEERKSPVSAGQRERPAPPVLESSSEVGLEESEAAPDIVSSDDEIMIFGSDDIEDEFGAMMPTIQQIYDAEPVSPAAGRGTAGESRAQRTPFREEELPVKSAEAPTEIPESGEQTACGPEVDELWNTAVKRLSEKSRCSSGSRQRRIRSVYRAASFMSLRKTITPKKCSWKRAKSSSNPSLRCITAALWRCVWTAEATARRSRGSTAGRLVRGGGDRKTNRRTLSHESGDRIKKIRREVAERQRPSATAADRAILSGGKIWEKV